MNKQRYHYFALNLHGFHHFFISLSKSLYSIPIIVDLIRLISDSPKIEVFKSSCYFLIVCGLDNSFVLVHQ
jgi:hypothetical protein